MMLPILISVSVAPMSYFFCANAAVELAARIASAAENNPNRTWIAGISISLIWFDCVVFLIGSACWLLVAFNTLRRFPATKSPPRSRRGGRYLVEGVLLREPARQRLPVLA